MVRISFYYTIKPAGLMPLGFILFRNKSNRLRKNGSSRWISAAAVHEAGGTAENSADQIYSCEGHAERSIAADEIHAVPYI